MKTGRTHNVCAGNSLRGHEPECGGFTKSDKAMRSRPCSIEYRKATGADVGAQKREITHCPSGHEYTEQNTVYWPSQPRSRRCIECQTSRSKQKWKEIGPKGRREIHLKHKYGITIEEFDLMIGSQDGRCAICGCIPTKPWHIDHCHKTGKLRKILCPSCNRGLRAFRDNIQTLLAVARYLEEYID